MKKKILQTIEEQNLIERGMHIVIGLSGGPDSVCLFDILRNMTEELEIKLYAVHVNHKLRPVEAEKDQQYVNELCQRWNIPCYNFTVDCNAVAESKGLTSEEAGRKARYQAFGETALKLCEMGVPKDKIAIALAHNANDQCETILFRIMRGTGTDGLAGIPYKRFDERGFAVIRPILDIKRQEIEKYCHERNLSPRIDHTNAENLYARNKIRNQLIPYIEENFNENITDTIIRLGKIASKDKDYLNAEAKKAYEEAVESGSDSERQSLNINTLKKLHSSIKFRVYTTALKKIGMEQNLTSAQAEAIDKLLESESPSAMCNLTDGFKAARAYERLVFLKSVTDDKQDQGWNFLKLSPKEFEEYKASHKDALYGAFCGVEIEELCIRTRKAGDRINLGRGSKKIQDFFVDQKVPKIYRDEIQLLARGSKILWVLPSKEFLTENLQRKGRFSADFRDFDSNEDSVIVLEKL